MATKNFTQFNTATPLTTSDYIVGYNAAGTAEIKTTVKDIIDLVQDSDNQELSFDENSKDLSITFGNAVSLSSLSNTTFQSVSAKYENVSTIVQTNSAQWATDSTVDTAVRALTGNWQSTYTTVQSNSGNWNTGIYMPLSFSNISNYDVIGDNVIRNLGDTIGMVIVLYPQTDYIKGLITSEDASNWYFTVQLQLISQYGSATIDTGFSINYSTSSDALTNNDINTAQSYNEASTVYEAHFREFSFTVPKTYLGNPVHFIRFNTIARRPTGGNTGIIKGFVRFKTN